MTSGKPELTTVSINSVTVDSYLYGWSVDMNSDNSTIKVIKITLSRGVENVLDIQSLNETAVTVQRGEATATEEYEFRGYVTEVRTLGSSIEIVAWDKMYLTTKIKVTTSFDYLVDAEAGVYSEIFKTLVTDYGGLTADATTVQDSGTTFIIKRFICKSSILFERLKTIADTLSWQFYYNSNDDKVYFEPKGHQNQTTTIALGTNVVERPKWTIDTSNLYTKLELRGAFQEVGTDESGRIGTTAGYTQASIQLNKTPIAVKVYSDASNPPTTLRAGGKPGSSTPYDYEVDVEQKKIFWNTSTYTPGATDYVKIEYTYPVPTPVVAQDDVSHGLYDPDPNVYKEMVLHKLDITDVNDAENYAREWLNDHKDPIYSTTVKVTNISDLRVGQVVAVDDSFNSISGNFYVVRVRKTYPYRFDEVDLVSNIIDEWSYTYDVLQRVKRLEEQNVNDGDTLLHVLSSSRAITYEPRYSDVTKKTYTDSVGVFILGHPLFAVLGTDELGDDQAPSETTIKRVQGNNTYKEFVYDNTFYDSGSSTGITWNTTTKTITFTGAATCITNFLTKGTSYSYATVTLGTLTGSLTIEISGNGGTNWQTVTDGIRTPIAVTDSTTFLLRLTSAANATLSPSYETTGQYKEPAIKVFLE